MKMLWPYLKVNPKQSQYTSMKNSLTCTSVCWNAFSIKTEFLAF